MSTTIDVRDAAEAVRADYDLTRQGSVGDKLHYEYTDDYFTLGEGGDVIMHDRIHGYYVEEIIAVRADGGRVVRWVRHRTGSTPMSEGQPAGDPVPFAFAEGLEVEVCFEDDFTVLAVDRSSLPTDLSGMHMLEHCIHSGIFSFFTSRRHGSIDRLRNVGDAVVMGASGQTPMLEFGGFIDIKMVRGTSVAHFDGISIVDERPAALLSFTLPQLFPFLNGGRGRGDASVRAWLALDTGEVLRGEMEQTNHLALPIGPDGSNIPMNQVVRAELLRIEASAYPS